MEQPPFHVQNQEPVQGQNTAHQQSITQNFFNAQNFLNNLKSAAKRKYVIACVGAILCLFSFFALPFLNVSATLSVNLHLGLVVVPPGTPTPTEYASAMWLSSYAALLWIPLLLVVAVLMVSLFSLVRENPHGSKEQQVRRPALGFVIVAVLAAVCLYVSLALTPQEAYNFLESTLGSSYFVSFNGVIGPDQLTFNTVWGSGAYLFLIGLATIGVAGLT